MRRHATIPVLAALVLAALAVLAPAARSAEPPMSAAEFESYVTGRTLTYAARGGAPYGAEQYLPGRRVIWTFLDGACEDGIWYEEAGQICFLYDFAPEPQCWSFWQGASGLIARFENDPGASELYEVRQSPEPLRCQGPEVGV
jgi:hypothetical protein